MNPNRLSAIMQPFVFILAGVFVVMLVYGFVSNDDYDNDDFTVTFTYDCNQVLTERNYANEVLQECLDLRDEIKRRNHK